MHCLSPIFISLALGVLDRNNLFDKINYKISLETKVITKVMRNAAVRDSGNWNYEIVKCHYQLGLKLPNVVVHDNDISLIIIPPHESPIVCY